MVSQADMTRAHRKVRQEVVMGRMAVPDVCSQCGNSPGLGKDGRRLLQAHHHRGYDRPLDVVWICVACHREETPCNPLKGESAVTAKLTEEAVRDIATGRMRAFEFARHYGVTPGAVHQVIKGKTWKHLGLFPAWTGPRGEALFSPKEATEGQDGPVVADGEGGK